MARRGRVSFAMRVFLFELHSPRNFRERVSTEEKHSSNLRYDKKRLWNSYVRKDEGNTNRELGKMSCGHVHWVQMTQDMVLGSKQTGNFLTSRATFSFPRRNLLHRLCYTVVTNSYLCSGDTMILNKEITDAIVVQ